MAVIVLHYLLFFENVGGGFQIRCSRHNADAFEQLINQIQNRSFGAEGHGGGGALSAGNPNQNYPNQGRAGSGKYIVWATPDISAKIPQMNRTPFGTSNSGNLDGGSDDVF